MNALRRVREQIAMLVNGAALYQCAVPNDGNRFLQSRRAVNDQELRPPQTAPNQIIENGGRTRTTVPSRINRTIGSSVSNGRSRRPNRF